MTDESHKEAIKRVLRYIDCNKEEDMSLDHLAKVACISKYHFHRLFRGYMGISLGQYMKLKRIERSMHDLTFGEQNILDIALSSGYENHTSFVKAFKKELDALVEDGVLNMIGPSEWAAPAFVVQKKDGRIHWVSDFRGLNACIEQKHYPLPKIKDIMNRRKKYKYFTKIDLSMFYYCRNGN